MPDRVPGNLSADGFISVLLLNKKNRIKKYRKIEE